MTCSRVVFLGAPGAGKGTQAQRVCASEELVHLSTGDLLRAAVKAGTEAGRAAQGFMEAGQLVPDEVVFGVLFERLEDGVDAFVLDGFPRNLPQAEELDRRLEASAKPLDVVVDIDVPEERLLARITGRRTCPRCSAMYHLDFKPPAAAGVCDACGAGIIQRKDDNAETVASRLAVYREQTEPLKDYYTRHGLLVAVDGDRSMDEVTGGIEQILAVAPTGGTA